VITLSDLPENPAILVITLRRIGDTLLTTPLVRLLREKFPRATLDMLVFDGSQGVLSGNPDIDNIIAVPQRMSAGQTMTLLRRLWRRYNLAISTQAGDRPTLLALLAGRRRIGLVPSAGDTGFWWKSRVYDHAVAADPKNHRVGELLRLAAALNLNGNADVVSPQRRALGVDIPKAPYAVLHAHPMYRYKQWTEAGWRALARALAERGLAIVATGGPDVAERSYLDALWSPCGVAIQRLDGRLDWPQLAELLAGAAIYIGPDTSMTHLAAATGCPTIALYGPTDPRLWGPWPLGGLEPAWAAAGSIQRRGNVWLVQNSLPCTPCQKEGCERHILSHSQCLDELTAGQVLAAADEALTWLRERGGGWRGGKKAGMETGMPLPLVKP
jgi:heptosyltransferase III